jgi:transposase-like protein
MKQIRSKKERLLYRRIVKLRIQEDISVCPTPTCTTPLYGNYDNVDGRNYFRCRTCNSQFSPFRDLPIKRTHIELSIWLGVLGMAITSIAGVSEKEITRRYGITEVSAYNLMVKLRDWHNRSFRLGPQASIKSRHKQLDPRRGASLNIPGNRYTIDQMFQAFPINPLKRGILTEKIRKK